MLKMLFLLVIALAAGAAVVVAYAMTKPDSFEVRRSADINAPRETVFPLINSLRSMNTWNPFLVPDPNIKISYSGPESGKGAAHEWDGNHEVGAGRLEITDSSPNSHVALRLYMARPMEAHNTVDFTLEPSGAATHVTWAMRGQQPLLGKVIAVFIDCEKIVGDQFEKGLASLKTLAEGR